MEGHVSLSVRQKAREKLDEWWGKAMDHAILFSLAVPIFEKRYGRELRYFTKREYVWTQSTSFGGNERQEWKEYQQLHSTDRRIMEGIIKELQK